MQSPVSGKEDEGLIFNIQKFSIHDGPGIRTTVFLKGCPLKCPWCSNPESQAFFPTLIVREIKCVQCGACLPACPRGAIRLQDGHRLIDRSICDNCLACVRHCIYQSLNICGKYLQMDDVIREILQDKAFYKNSGGGMTVSGGEPLGQAHFTQRLLQEGKKHSLHTALDTTGYAPWKTMERVLPYVDLVLFDIKHLDPAIHLRTTGVDNALILDNLKKIAGQTKVWLRVPLIAGFNDSVDHTSRLIALSKAHHIQKISLLPYHEGGRSKCEQLGIPYSYAQAAAPSDENVLKLKRLIEEEGLEASVGN